MKDERIIDLVNGELDGTNGPSESEELASHLESDPAVKEYFDDMEGLDRLLAAVPLVDPPPTLKSRVMNAVAQQESSSRVASRASWLDSILEPFRQRPAWAVTYAFAAGIIVGLAVLSVVQSAGPDTGVVQGTIVSVAPPVVAETHIAAGTSAAEVLVSTLDDELRVDVRLQSESQVAMTLAPEGADPITVESADSQSYSVIFPRTSRISVTLTANEATKSAVMTVLTTGE